MITYLCQASIDNSRLSQHHLLTGELEPLATEHSTCDKHSKVTVKIYIHV